MARRELTFVRRPATDRLVAGSRGLILAATVVLIPALGLASEVIDIREQVKEIKANDSLSGLERAGAVQQLLRDLPDGQFFALANAIGAERFLPPRPSSPTGLRSEGAVDAPVMRNRADPQAIGRLLQQPQDREQVTRGMAIYLLNTTTSDEGGRR